VPLKAARGNKMTAEKYVKEVSKLLKCRASKKKEISGKLLSEIKSEVAAGESLENVLAKKGIPWDFANHYNDHFDKAEQKAAKREKTMKIWGIVIVVILIAAGIIYWNMPKWSDISKSTVFDEEQVRAAAEEIITLYSDDEYEAVVAYMTDDMKEVLNAPTLALSKSQLVTEDFGELQSFGQMYISEAKQGRKMFAMVQVSVSYTNTSVMYTLTFDADMKLAGFYVK